MLKNKTGSTRFSSINCEGFLISLSLRLPQVFKYMYTTAPRPSMRAPQGGTTPTPMAGLGYGLPLSRLYARYFSGDITLNSMDGLGTRVNLYFRALPTEAGEVLPVFNNSTAKESYRELTTAPRLGHWTDPVLMDRE